MLGIKLVPAAVREVLASGRGEQVEANKLLHAVLCWCNRDGDGHLDGNREKDGDGMDDVDT